ncbi:hypothetical protein M3223_13990 [Paenibacillus pasadenensis]|nr:hypothetical protein [Paenibacillus pasadenensis]
MNSGKARTERPGARRTGELAQAWRADGPHPFSKLSKRFNEFKEADNE